MSSDDKQVVVNISASKEYMLPSNHGEVSVDTTSASTSYQHTSANSDNVSQVRFDVPIGKNLAMSKNIKLKFRAKFLCRANIPLTVLPADVTALDWKQAMGDFSDISFAPAGILSITDTMSFSYGTGNTLTISNPSEQLQMILACTNKNIIDKSLSDCMLKPDLKYSYDLEDTVADFNVAGLKNEAQWLRRSSTFDSPFSGTDDSEWGSRLPAYSIDVVNTSGVNSLTHFYLNVDLHTFIPSSLFNTKNSYSGTNFFGIEKFNLNMNLRSVYGKLFSFKPNSTQRFEAERMTFSEKPELTTTVYTPPSFIQDHIRSDDGSIKDYMVGFSYLDNVCNDTISGSVAPRAARVGYSYNSISTPTLPKRLYIGVISNMDIPLHGSIGGHEMGISQKSRIFARIDSAVLTINGTRSLVGARSEEL